MGYKNNKPTERKEVWESNGSRTTSVQNADQLNVTLRTAGVELAEIKAQGNIRPNGDMASLIQKETP